MNNVSSENYDESESGTGKNSWIQVTTGKKKGSGRQNYPQKVNKLHFQTAAPHDDTCKNRQLDIMFITRSHLRFREGKKENY